jgi:riboflavin synthase alpha subunit
VNLERAMRADSRFDGHIVQGHVDGIGTIEDITGHGDDVRVVITFDVACAPFIIPQGSVAIDGVSLTIVDVRDQRLTVVLVPQTRSMTTLGSLRKDDRVNIETDVLLRAVVHARDAQ